MSDTAFVKALVLVLIPIVCGVIFQAGRLAERVESHRRDLDGVGTAIREGFKEIAELIRGVRD